jgi:hypothetical protein
MRWLVSPVTLLSLSVGCGASSAAPPRTESRPSPAASTSPAGPEVPAQPTEARSEQPPVATTHAVGERAQALDYALVVESVKECKPSYYFSKPSPGNIWLGIELVVESISETPVWASPSLAKLVDASGRSYSYALVATTDCEPGLRSGELARNEKGMGWVVFDVPESARGFTLLYDPMLVDAPQPLRFELAR